MTPIFRRADPARGDDAKRRISDPPVVEIEEGLTVGSARREPGVIAPSSRREPMTREKLAELLRILLEDVQVWSSKYGYSTTPPIELLRQAVQIADLSGRAYQRGREGL